MKIKIDPPQEVYFYEKQDGSVFGCAWKDAIVAHKYFKQVGYSSGLTFVNKLKDLQSKQDALSDEELKSGVLEAQKAELESAKGNFKTPPLNNNLTGKTGFKPAFGAENMIR